MEVPLILRCPKFLLRCKREERARDVSPGQGVDPLRLTLGISPKPQRQTLGQLGYPERQTLGMPALWKFFESP